MTEFYPSKKSECSTESDVDLLILNKNELTQRKFEYTYGKNAFELSQRKCEAFIDGSCSPNPGMMGIGVVIYDIDTKQKVWSCSKCIGRGTNNIAELNAALIAINAAKQLKYDAIQISGDSEIAIYATAEIWKLASPNLIQLRNKLINAKNGIIVKCKWIPRERNTEADKLSASCAPQISATNRIEKKKKHNKKGQNYNTSVTKNTEFKLIRKPGTVTYITGNKVVCSICDIEGKNPIFTTIPLSKFKYMPCINDKIFHIDVNDKNGARIMIEMTLSPEEQKEREKPVIW